MANLIPIKDGTTGSTGWLDTSTHKLYGDREGLRLIAQYTPTASIDDSQLAEYAAMSDAAMAAKQRGRPTRLRDERRFTDSEGERLVTMDMGVNDVHISGPMPGVNLQYNGEDGVADIASPVTSVTNQTNSYWIADKENTFQRVASAINNPGDTPGEISPTRSSDSYKVQQYALQTYVSTEVISNQDPGLNVFQESVDMLVRKLRIEREYRVAAALTTAANFDSSLVQSLASSAGWRTGASSDPVKNLQDAIDASWQEPTAILWTRRVGNMFVRNANVQKYLYAKSNEQAKPRNEAISSAFELPPIVTARMKVNSSGTAKYVWDDVVAGGTGAVVLVYEAPGGSSEKKATTNKTFRWNGGAGAGTNPDVMSMVAGFTVRTYFAQPRGGRGGHVAVVIHEDAEKQTSKYLGGLILGVDQ